MVGERWTVIMHCAVHSALDRDDNFASQMTVCKSGARVRLLKPARRKNHAIILQKTGAHAVSLI